MGPLIRDIIVETMTDVGSDIIVTFYGPFYGPEILVDICWRIPLTPLVF